MQILFLIVACVTLVTAFLVTTSRNLIHSALWLIATLFGVAILYAMLNAGFFAIIQVVIYIGAIAILFIFAVMLTRRVMKDSGPLNNSNWWAAALVSVILFGGLVWMLSRWSGFATALPALTNESGKLAELGRALVSSKAYVLPFELASVLLVAALIGALWVSVEKK